MELFLFSSFLFGGKAFSKKLKLVSEGWEYYIKLIDSGVKFLG